MKDCPSCKKSFLPSGRHKNCPTCREKDYKISYNNRCNCGKLIQQQSKNCVQCNNKLNAGRYLKYRYASSGGYIYVRQADHPRSRSNKGLVFEHILVMEKYLGRYLLPNENVHHKNGIKIDNRPENLELWVKGQPNGARVRDLISYAKEILKLYGNDKSKYL